MSRRSRPPRTRKSRTPEAPPVSSEPSFERDVVVVIPPTESPGEELGRGAATSRVSPLAAEPSDELAALDAGWD
jgi:hypothetical protein